MATCEQNKCVVTTLCDPNTSEVVLLVNTLDQDGVLLSTNAYSGGVAYAGDISALVSCSGPVLNFENPDGTEAVDIDTVCVGSKVGVSDGTQNNVDGSGVIPAGSKTIGPDANGDYCTISSAITYENPDGTNANVADVVCVGAKVGVADGTQNHVDGSGPIDTGDDVIGPDANGNYLPIPDPKQTIIDGLDFTSGAKPEFCDVPLKLIQRQDCVEYDKYVPGSTEIWTPSGFFPNNTGDVVNGSYVGKEYPITIECETDIRVQMTLGIAQYPLTNCEADILISPQFDLCDTAGNSVIGGPLSLTGGQVSRAGHDLCENTDNGGTLINFFRDDYEDVGHAFLKDIPAGDYVFKTYLRNDTNAEYTPTSGGWQTTKSEFFAAWNRCITVCDDSGTMNRSAARVANDPDDTPVASDEDVAKAVADAEARRDAEAAAKAELVEELEALGLSASAIETLCNQ